MISIYSKKFYGFVGISFLFLVSAVFAEAVTREDIVREQYSQLNAIDGLSYRYQVKSVSAENSVAQSPKVDMKLTYVASGKNYLYSIDELLSTGKPKSYKVAFDSEKKMWFCPIDGILNIKKSIENDSNETKDPLNPFSNGFYLPYFFIPKQLETDRFLVKPNFFKDKRQWENYGENLKVTGDIRYGDLDCVVVELDRKIWCENLVNRFRIICSKSHHYFPVKWEALHDNKILFSYECTSVGSYKNPKTQSEIFYPLKDCSFCYEENGQIFYKTEGVLNGVAINDPAVSESDFTIDPSLATVIRDEDTHVSVTVPK